MIDLPTQHALQTSRWLQQGVKFWTAWWLMHTVLQPPGAGDGVPPSSRKQLRHFAWRSCAWPSKAGHYSQRYR